MLTFDAAQTTAAALTSKEVKWVFTVTDKNAVVYYYSTGTIAGITPDIVITDFSGIDLRRNQAEQGIIAPSDVSFTISNAGTTMTFSDFKGGSVLIELYVSTSAADTKLAGWTFRIKTAEPGYQNIRIVAEDFLQYYLKGDYPNTRIVADVFPSNRSYENEGVCVPVPFGTAYVPLRDVFIDGTVSVSANTLAAVASASGSRCKFTDSANGLGGIEQGRTITVAGFTDPANNGTFTVLSVSAAEIEVAYDAGLVGEAAGDNVTITHGSGYIMLGSPAGGITYTVTKVRSPRSLGQKSEWDSATYTFTQSTIADAAAVDWRLFQAIIFDLDKDGTADSPGFFQVPQTALVYDPLITFTRSDTASLTCPADVIAFVLEDMGVPSAMIDDGVGGSFSVAKAVYAGWGLTFNGAFYYKEDRKKVLAKLLNMCHSCLDVGETIKLRVLSKTSKKTFTAADIMRSQAIGEGTFQYRDIASDNYSDSGYVLWQKTGEPQDKFLKVLVAADAAANVISNEVLECPFVQNSEDVQRIGKLFYQRKLLKEAEVNFISKGTNIALQPDDIVTINAANYGGNYTLLIDGIHINKDLSLQFTCSKYTSTFDDWGDLAPTALTIPTDDTIYAWQPSVSGPQSALDIGNSAFDSWGKEYLTVGPTANVGKFTDIQKALNAVNQAGGGAIYILNGTYQATAPWYVPDVNLEITGQSQGGVILKNLAGSNLFVLHNLTKTFNLKLFSIESQNVAAFSRMLYFYGDAAANNTATLNCIQLSISCIDDDTGHGSGDYGISSGAGNSTLIVEGCRITGGAFNIISSGDYAKIINNALFSAVYASISGSSGGTKDIEIKGNSIKDIYEQGITWTASQAAIKINNNILEAISTSAASDNFYGISVSNNKGDIVGNTILVNNTNIVHASHMIGCVPSTGQYSDMHITENTIDIIVDTHEALCGIDLAGIADSVISANRIKINNSNSGEDNTYGIRLKANLTPNYCLRNNISNNVIDLVDSRASDIGISLAASCNNNAGQENVFYRCGKYISDAGTGNLINKSGGGTF